MLKDKIKPRDFRTEEDHFWNTLGQFETERIARNIVLICDWNGNEWFNFTWEDYQRLCKHEVTISEKHILDQLVRERLLDFDDGKYAVNNAFLEKIKSYIRGE